MSAPLEPPPRTTLLSANSQVAIARLKGMGIDPQRGGIGVAAFRHPRCAGSIPYYTLPST
jgi:hypothetical protein